MSKSGQQILLHGDVDAIKEFVFETSSLPQIRGGSQLLLECEDEVTKKIEKLGGKKIYCSGGSFLFELPEDKVNDAREAIEDIYLNHTLTATVTISHESDPLPPAPASHPHNGWSKRLWDAHQPTLQSGDFARRVAFLSAQVRRMKYQRSNSPFFEAIPFGKRCEACGKRVAVENVHRYEPEEQEQVEIVSLCVVCLQRHRTGVRSEAHTVRGRFNVRFYQKYRQCNLTARHPPDLDHLVKSARRNYVAFLYADGNDIGQLLQRVSSQEEFAALSQALREGTEQALFEALWEVCSEELQKVDRYWPFEIVNIGGDDVTLLIQAGYAWEVAIRFLERFEKEIKSRVTQNLGYWPQSWPQAVTASCGIAVADVKHPVRYLEYLANDLLRSAKREAKMVQAHPQSALTFLWLPTPIAAEKAEALMSYYQRDINRLTARPYSLDRARKSIALVKEASRWPRSLRHRWGEMLDRGMWISLNMIYYDIARRSDQDRLQLTTFLSEVGELATQQGYQTKAPSSLWQVYKKHSRVGWQTALLDILELAELRAMRADVQIEEQD